MSRDGRSLQVRRDAHGVPLWLALPGGQVYWLSLSNSGTLRKVSAQGHDIAHITYHGNTGLLATKSDENSWTTVYEWVCGLFIKLICLLRSSVPALSLFSFLPSCSRFVAWLWMFELTLHCMNVYSYDKVYVRGMKYECHLVVTSASTKLEKAWGGIGRCDCFFLSSFLVFA